MAEKFTLAVPRPLGVPSNEVSIIAIYKRRSPEWYLHIEVQDEQGRVIEFNLTGAEAQASISALNKANNTVKSEERKILENLVSTGKLTAGAFSGAPD